MVEGSSEYKLMYHGLISEFINKLLSLTQDVVLSLKQVLNLLDSPVPETFRYSFLVVSFSSRPFFQLQHVPPEGAFFPPEVQLPGSFGPDHVPAACLVAEAGAKG